MIHLINFLVRLLAFVLVMPAHSLLMVISLILWDRAFYDYAEAISERIWADKK